MRRGSSDWISVILYLRLKLTDTFVASTVSVDMFCCYCQCYLLGGNHVLILGHVKIEVTFWNEKCLSTRDTTKPNCNCNLKTQQEPKCYKQRAWIQLFTSHEHEPEAQVKVLGCHRMRLRISSRSAVWLQLGSLVSPVDMPFSQQNIASSITTPKN